MAFGYLAAGGRDAAVVGAVHGVHAFLGDHALGFTLTDVGLALVIGDHDADLGAAEVRQTFALGQRHVEIGFLVDDLEGGVERRHGVDAGLGHGPAERIDDADDDLVRGGRDPPQGQGRQRGNGNG